MINDAIDAVLFDLDGVLYIGNQRIAHADETLNHIRSSGLKMAGVTNTTTMPKRHIIDKLQRLALPFSDLPLFTPAALACEYIGKRSAKLFIQDSLREDFQAIHEDEQAPDDIVMGDIGGEGYPPETLRRIFLHIMQGSRLLALHKNRFWQKEDGLHLDLGCFVAAIEYASGCDAIVLGKPSPDFFLTICKVLDITPARTLMVGDDIESDIGGAQQAGLKTALVQTGKYREDFVRKTGITPDVLIPSVADLPDALSLL